jgi:hypothetical protein
VATNKNNYSSSIAGLKIASRYGFRPHCLGLCGPKQAHRENLLQKFLRGGVSAAKMKPIFRKFLGAYPYYKLIARSNKIKNPFDEKVVAAYWIGNELLEKVKTEDLRKMVAGEFSGPGLLPKEIAAKKAAVIPRGSKPHHSFHVLIIGSVTGSVDFKSAGLKDLCRVGWGKVVKIPNPKSQISNLVVEYRPLVGGKKIKLGKPIKKEIIWNKNLMAELKKGDWVTFHWNYICEKINLRQKKNLIYWTNYHLRLL